MTFRTTLIRVLLCLAPLGAVAAPAPNAQQQESRAVFYRFGEGYATAAIQQASVAGIASTRVDSMTRKEARAPGLIVSWFEISDMPDKPTRDRLRVSHKGHLVSDIYIGKSSVEDVRKALGAPAKESPTQLTYPGMAEICSDWMTFNFSDGKLREVDWQWCAD